MNPILILLLAQSLHRHPMPAPEPVSVEVAADAGAAPSTGREPSWISQAPVAVTPAPVEHAPFWIYPLGIGILLSPLLLFLRRKKDPNAIAARFALPSTPVAPEAPPEKLPARTPEVCHGLYLEGVEGLVKRMVWPEKLSCVGFSDGPVETRWRAWLGTTWDSSLIRANGRTQGQALKGLLRCYREHGGAWTAHALERSQLANAAMVSK